MSRDGNGNYTLPLGAVATGEVIASTWANTSLDDIAAAMTDSLARSGNGGMLAPFRATDGTINAPSLSFNNETNSGVYRSSAGDYRLCVNGKDKARIRDVNGMAAFQVFDLAGTGAWETLATAADVAALSLATVLAVGNTTGGTDISVSAGDDLLLTDTSKIIASNGLSGSLERSFQLYVDGPSNGIIKFESRGNKLSITSGSSVQLANFSGWPMVEATQVDARLSYGTGAGGNLEKLVTTATGVTVTGELKCDDVELAIAGEIVGLGDVKITPATGGDVVLTDSLGFARVKSNENSAFLYYGLAAGATAEKLQTIATGIDVTGTVEADGFSGTGTVAITDFIDDDTFATATATNVPTAESVKAYVDASGGSETLAQTLVLGKATGGTDIELTAGDVLTAESGSYVNIRAAVAAGVRLTSSAGVARVSATETSAALYHGAIAADATKVLETTSTGVDVTGTIDCNNSLQIRSTGSNVDAMPDLYMSNLEGAAAAQNLGMISFRGYNLATTPAIKNYADVYAQQVVVTDGAEEGKLIFDVLGAGAKVEALQVTKDGIDVTGTVTADAIKFTTDATDDAKIFTVLSGSTTALVIQSKDDADDSIILRCNNPGVGEVNVLVATKTGIDVTGTVEADAFIGDSISSAGTGTEVVFNDSIKLANSATKILGNDDITLRPAAAKETNLETSAGRVRVQVTDTLVRLYYGANLNQTAAKLETSDAGVDITGDLDVTGTITSNAFAYSKATVNNAADILYTAFNSFAGKRIINTASATATTYGLPTPVAADIGKSWIICNPTDSEITIDHDASGTANYIWIMDGVTLSAAASSWTIKKGAIVEIVVAAAAAGGGGLQAPNYLIFGAGLLEI